MHSLSEAANFSKTRLEVFAKIFKLWSSSKLSPPKVLHVWQLLHLLVVSTRLTNITVVNMGIFPNFRGENKKIFELPPPSYTSRNFFSQGKNVAPELAATVTRVGQRRSWLGPSMATERSATKGRRPGASLNSKHGFSPPKRKQTLFRRRWSLTYLDDHCWMVLFILCHPNMDQSSKP